MLELSALIEVFYVYIYMYLLIDQGYYAYIESSAPRRTGDKARLVGPKITDRAPRCLTFWFVSYILYYELEN